MSPEQLIRNDILFAAEQIGDQVMAELEEHHNIKLKNLEVDTGGRSTVVYGDRLVGVNVVPKYIRNRLRSVTLDSKEIDGLHEPLSIELSEYSIKQWDAIIELIVLYDKLSDVPYATVQRYTNH